MNSTNISALTKRDHLSLTVSTKLYIKKPITKFEDLNKQAEVLETQLVLLVKQITQVLGSIIKSFNGIWVGDDIGVDCSSRLWRSERQSLYLNTGIYLHLVRIEADPMSKHR